jgi:RHS repeat-associated protein
MTSDQCFSYRFGFNGKEQDNEVAGEGNSYTAEFWQYDSRLGRRFNMDPKGYKVPGTSLYSVMFNNPIIFTDKDGDFPDPLAPYIFKWLRSSGGLLVTFRESQIYAGVGGLHAYAMKQDGEIYDKVGFTVFSARASITGGFTDDGDKNLFVGGGAELFDIGFFRKTGTNEGTGFLDEATPFAVNVGPVDVQFTDDGFGVSGGISADIGINKLNYESYKSFSMTEKEYEKVNGMLSMDELLTTGILKVGNVSNITDQNGKVVGQTGELMVKTRSHWYNRNTYWESTGITVSNTTSKKDKEVWKSEDYNNEQYDAAN